MLVPVKWLKDYVDFDMASRQLADALTMSGSHVDSIKEMNKGVEKVVVGKILEITQHPNADKLVITKTDVGEDVLQIVTGATNIKEGDYVPIALVGSRLPGGMKIKKGKLRGEVSNGMMCSAKELGIDEDTIPKEQKDGIFILDGAYELGEDIKSVLDLNDEIIEFEITPNRPDCLSIIGMARETAATLGTELKEPVIKINNETEDIKDYVKAIDIADEDLCSRYYSRVVKNVTVKPSPLWMQMRLIKAGIRPINNIVDVTNYVMLEMGQPLHAFDLDKIEDKKIIVRKAEKGEKIVTLDGVERQLEPSMLVIADGKKPVAIAGVMGGENSEVTDGTKTILIESANFNGRSIRLTSRGVSLRTEASAKFEKDLDQNLAEAACNRVCQLLEQVEAGDVVGNFIDVYTGQNESRRISLRVERVKKLLGVEIDPKQMVESLKGLELEAELTEDKIEVTVPTFRQDIRMEADLVEEIGRIYGFHNIESKPLIGTLTMAEKSTTRKVIDRVKATLTGLGLNEVMTYSFISPKAYDKIELSDESIKRRYVELLNPLGEDYSVMRTTLIPNMLDVLSRNYKHGVEKAWAYEIGNVFVPKALPVTSLPYEIKNLCVGMYGATDFFDLKGIMDTLLEDLGIEGAEYVVEENYATFHPGRTGNILVGNHVLGTVGEIHPDVMDNYGIKERVYMAEIDVDILCLLTNVNRTYKPLPKYPAITRDIAVVLDEDIMVQRIENIIWKYGKELVETVVLFDVYSGAQISEGKKSVAYSITYRSYEKTLTDDEITPVHGRIVDKLQEELNATLRA